MIKTRNAISGPFFCNETRFGKDPECLGVPQDLVDDFIRAARPRTFDHVCDLIAVALGLFTPTECRNFVRHCGYLVSTAL